MEGTLLKWTNYYNGWQPRHFILNETGIISYYKSSELIHEGCKGSCLVVACEVKIHPHDSLRFDLIIPGEQFFCLKAKSPSERQRWLVALGSWKSRGTKSTTKSMKTSNDNTPSLISHLNAIDDELKLKVQELRLYETVLMQRIQAVKSIANDTPTPDVKILDETTSMLNIACDAFIQTLDECVKLATSGSSQSLLLSSSTPSLDSNNMLIDRTVSNEMNFNKTTDVLMALPKQIVYRTFFSDLIYTFSTLTTLSFDEINSELFLFTCEKYFELIDKFNGTPLDTFRSDTISNMSKLTNRICTNQKKFENLLSIINDEISTQAIKEKDSATNSLLWLRRSIHFLSCFLHEFGQGDKTVEDAMNQAYGKTLKPYHGWITRGLFAEALRSVPSNEDFLISLAINPNEAKEVLFERQILNEMIQHSNNMNVVVRKLNDFYIEHNLESDEIIG
ncbi:unnamed protein product [Rotaria magnacalcarata]|uniref:Pleckstrin homology domain-containing family A member 8 n=1 Tax=Rotaria magnacalcarata TaxID=392030 RepID=A0A819UEN0_9BILA|nr:unnamed protein product [Rotaria magnacalcarata]CAF1556104.1 unnamed protein product [Rotaria magnacalcarata]CAF2045936.1 unnamed protein product [Rotaria magnacalcarata]CAF2074973.1 unnamed protein product [Rotaria magnacalcarata]CAF3976758.1 unnamed protein product [Rotaria magnacalcarata]